MYEAEAKKTIQTLNSMPKGMEWNIISRIRNLEHIQHHLEKYGDEFEQLLNVKNLIQSYKDGALKWDGQVTYISAGKAMGRGKFSWDDVHKYHDMCQGQSFWVEGVSYLI